MADILQARRRRELGTMACRRLRRQGMVPAVLYGHGLENVPLSLSGGELTAAIRHGSKLVEIAGEVSDSALLREVQWDPLGVEVLHVDLTRVSADEAVEVEIAVELRGEAPGMKEGGMLQQPLHAVEILCPAGAIPESLVVNVNQLHLNSTITARELHLPENASLITDPDSVVVQCVAPQAEVEAPVAAGETAEPEVIGRAASEEETET